jgi:hypothetical protein
MILFINASICLTIAIRLFLFQRDQHQYKLCYALLAWGLVCASSAVAILTLFNQMSQAQTAQTIMNLLVLICMLKTKGNVAQFICELFAIKHMIIRQTKKVKLS